jgi:uncharacterized protein YbaP (TraB family)
MRNANAFQMNKPSRLISGLLLACLFALPRMAAQDAAGAPAKKALFWKASSATNVIYLLGSLHLGSKSMYPLPQEIEDAFGKSSALLVEVDMNHVDKQKIQAMVMETGLYPGDDLLWDHVSKETKESLEKFCATYGIPSQPFAKMKPWMAAIGVSAIAMVKNGMDPKLGIDQYFLDKAGMAGDQKRVVEIESAESQLKLLSGFTDDVQTTILAVAMEGVGKIPEKLGELRETWLKGDAAEMDRLMSESSRIPDDVRKALLQDRNLHMADVAEQFLNGNEQAFVVVGAAHMVGKDGIVRILAKRGYTVEQVSLK